MQVIYCDGRCHICTNPACRTTCLTALGALGNDLDGDGLFAVCFSPLTVFQSAVLEWCIYLLKRKPQGVQLKADRMENIAY